MHLLSLVSFSTVENWLCRSTTDFLQDGCLASVCTPYDEDAELDLWELTMGFSSRAHGGNWVWEWRGRALIRLDIDLLQLVVHICRFGRVADGWDDRYWFTGLLVRAAVFRAPTDRVGNTCPLCLLPSLFAPLSSHSFKYENKWYEFTMFATVPLLIPVADLACPKNDWAVVAVDISSTTPYN